MSEGRCVVSVKRSSSLSQVIRMNLLMFQLRLLLDRPHLMIFFSAVTRFVRCCVKDWLLSGSIFLLCDDMMALMFGMH